MPRGMRILGDTARTIIIIIKIWIHNFFFAVSYCLYFAFLFIFVIFVYLL